MIKRDQFAGKYSQSDVDIMNAAVGEAVFYFDIETADLNDRERLTLLDEIETNVMNSFFNGRVLYQTQDLLPEIYRRFLVTRADR